MGETERVEAYVHPMWRPSAFADSRTARRLAVVVSLAIFYFIAGKIGLRFATFHPSTTAIWAPTGISLAGALVFGYWVWPGIFAGAFWSTLRRLVHWRRRSASLRATHSKRWSVHI